MVFNVHLVCSCHLFRTYHLIFNHLPDDNENYSKRPSTARYKIIKKVESPGVHKITTHAQHLTDNFNTLGVVQKLHLQTWGAEGGLSNVNIIK